MTATWNSRIRKLLLQWRGNGPGWGYRPESEAYVEPTVLAALALTAIDAHEPSDGCRSAVASAAEWLAARQHPDGSLGLSATLPVPQWNTSLGLLLWSLLHSHSESRERAAQWLLSHQGDTRVPPSGGIPFSHDSSIPGWSWVAGTHAWLEPTAWAVLALSRAGFGNHRRVEQGRRLICDRALRSGGWNYGNSQVFGADLRPQPGPTGLALLALAGNEDRHGPRIDRACSYLARILPTTRAPQSLCWGLLGLAAWGCRPPEARHWLESAVDKAIVRSDCIVQAAYLLLAASPGTLDLLGVVA